VYEEKAAYVEKHRKRLVREADKATREAHGCYMDALDALERAREELVESREQALWAELYPSDLAQVFPAWSQLATGLRKPVEQTPGIKTVTTAASVIAALRADADVLREVATRDQAAAIRGVSAAKLTGREAQCRRVRPTSSALVSPPPGSGAPRRRPMPSVCASTRSSSAGAFGASSDDEPEPPSPCSRTLAPCLQHREVEAHPRERPPTCGRRV
jgi:hypothetical protein